MDVNVTFVGQLARTLGAQRDVTLPEDSRLADLFGLLTLPAGQEVMALVDDGPAHLGTVLHQGAIIRIIPIVDGG